MHAQRVNLAPGGPQAIDSSRVLCPRHAGPSELNKLNARLVVNEEQEGEGPKTFRLTIPGWWDHTGHQQQTREAPKANLTL